MKPGTEELKERLKILQQNLQKEGLAGAFILSNVNLYYYTGIIEAACFYIPADGQPVFLTRKRGPLPHDLPWPVRRFKRWGEVFERINEFNYPAPGKLGLEFEKIPASVYLKLRESGYSFSDITLLVRNQRALKSDWERALMRETAARDKVLWEMVPEFLKKAQTDYELAGMFEGEARRRGHLGVFRLHGYNQEMATTCVLVDEKGNVPSPYDAPLSGAGTSPAFPFGPSGAKIEEGKPILIDFGGCYFGYVVDQTRNFIIHYVPAEVRKAFDTSVQILKDLEKLAQPGAVCGELYDHALMVAAESGVPGFMGSHGGVSFVGHGVGLEIDELPVLARGSQQRLQAGMVLAIEPKFTLPGFGAVGIETSYEVTDHGLVSLSKLADELIVVQK